MRKLAFLFVILALHTSAAIAQGAKLEKSVGFDEPDDGWNKVLLLKNGNTFFFNFSKGDGIQIMVFDKSRKLVGTREITSELWDSRKMKRTLISGLFEINNEAVLFITQPEGRTPTLYRLRFSGETGKLVKEEEIGELAKSKLIVYGTSPDINTAYVEKDPESDCYAVILFNNHGNDLDDRIKVLHYDGSHKLIHNVAYECPSDDFKFMRYIGAVVDGNKRVYMGIYGAGSRRGKDGQVFIARLNANEAKFTNKELDFTEDFKETKSVMAYNRMNNTIQLLTLTYSGASFSWLGHGGARYNTFMSYIDPETLGLKSVKPILGEKIDQYAHDVLNTRLDYHGLPQQMVLNKDGSATVLSEEITYEIVRDQKGNVISARTYLGAIGVNEINPDGTEKSGYGIRKMQMAGGLIDPLYLSARYKGRWTYNRLGQEHNSYMSYDYVNTDKNRYIIYNDDNKNFDKDEDERRRKTVVKVNKLNTICYSLNQGSSVNKFFLFGDPADKDESFSCHIEASDYSPATNTYATVMIEREGRDRTAKLVWATFE